MFRKLLHRVKRGCSRKLEVAAEAIIPRAQHSISKTDISRHALTVLNKLNHAGFEAYLVGGCIRDLLCRHAPKDFDVATNAHPNQVRKLFRNCRLIGKRFRLAHILFGREIIEVATFRAAPRKHQMLGKDNEYGTLVEDAWRRDFTINALYYNIADSSVVDITGGFEDINNKLIRIIGKPNKRYHEDPVRILRAIRFAAKLGFSLETETAKAIKPNAHLLKEVSSARLFDEVVKLYYCGQAVQLHQYLVDHDCFQALFPNADPHSLLLKAALENTDERLQAGKPVTPAFLFAVLLWAPLQAEAEQLRDTYPGLVALEKAMGRVINQQSRTVSIQRRYTQVMREIWTLQSLFNRRQGDKAYRLLEHPRFRAAYDLLLLRSRAGEVEQTLAQWWTDFQVADTDTQAEMLSQIPAPKRRRRRRRNSGSSK